VIAAAAGEYLLNVLVINKPTYKGLIVPGGKVDMMFTAKGFGKEDGEHAVSYCAKPLRVVHVTCCC
jgi:hypothetical protein